MRGVIGNLADKAFDAFGSLAERVTLVKLDKTIDPVTGVVTTKEQTRSCRMVLSPYSTEERGMAGIELADTRGYFLASEVGSMTAGDEIERAESVNLRVISTTEWPGTIEAQLRKAG